MSDIKKIKLRTLEQNGFKYLYPKTSTDLVEGLKDSYKIKTTTTTDGFEKSYQLTVQVEGETTPTFLTDTTINVPFQWRLISGLVKQCTEEGKPEVGYKVGDVYVVYTLQKNVGDTTFEYLYTKLCSAGYGIKIEDTVDGIKFSVDVTDENIWMNHNNNGQAGLVPTTIGTGILPSGQNKESVLLSGDAKWIAGITYENIN